MAFSLAPFADVGLNEALLELVIDEHRTQRLARLTKWWAYFRNASRAGWGPGEVHGGGGSKGLAQEAGLPARLTGRASAAVDDRALTRREIVIENDIAWRIQTMVDFMFGKPVRIESTAPDAGRAALIGQVLDAVWEASGGISLLQDMALLGHVHGHDIRPVGLPRRAGNRRKRRTYRRRRRRRRLRARRRGSHRSPRARSRPSVCGWPGRPRPRAYPSSQPCR